MKINLSLKYWSRHKKRAFTIILAIAISMAALTCVTFLARSSSVSTLERLGFDYSGYYDLHIINISENNLERYQNDDRFTETGIMYRGGVTIPSGGSEFVYGALSDSAIPLYHYTLEDGRYPRQSGEIAAYRTFIEANGCAAEIGNTIALELRDFDGNVIERRKFTIVGVLWDQDGSRTVDRLYSNRRDYIFPQAFLCSVDMPKNAELNLLANCYSTENLTSIKTELVENNIDFHTGNRISMYKITASVGLASGASEEQLYNALKYSYKDFYARALIPIFSGVTLLVSFVSISNVISTSLSERKRQLAMLRCIGMEKRKALKMALFESLVMVIWGVAAGFPLGISGYALTLFIQKNLLGIHIYPAFTVNPIIAATTVNPYIYPAVACFIVSFLAVLIPYIIEMRSSPVEALSDNHRDVFKKGFRTKRKSAVIGKISSGFRQNISFGIIVIAVAWSAIFGYAFFSAQAAEDNRTLELALEKSRLIKLDYVAQRSEFYTLGNAQLNRHHLGISPQLATEVSEYKDAELFFAAIEAKSTKAVYDSETVDEEIAKALSSTNTDNLIQYGLEELFLKTRLAQGYSESELLFNVPTLGVSADTLDMLSEFIVEGNYNKQKLLSGEEILILQTTKDSPYSVGDVIPMTDIVIEDEAAEVFEFQYGGVPEGAEPSFYHSYSDDPTGYQWEGYAFGTRQDYTVTVGGIVKITDENIRSFFQTSGLVGNSGFNILCADSAFENWELPDRNYTKMGVKLSEKADMENFEKLWYKVLGNSSKVTSSSVASIKRQMSTVTLSNMSIFFAIIITVVILGLIGIINSVNLRVRRGSRSYSTLRAIGLSKKGLISLILRQGLICAVIGAVTSLIPLGVYEYFRQLTVKYLNDGRGAYEADTNGRYDFPWQKFFPWNIEIWQQPIFLIILVALLAVCAVILISNIVPAVWIAKKNITEALRSDDF